MCQFIGCDQNLLGASRREEPATVHYPCDSDKKGSVFAGLLVSFSVVLDIYKQVVYKP